MSSLDAINVRVEATTGNVVPLLHEVRHALLRLVAGESNDDHDVSSNGQNAGSDSNDNVIDLRSLPLAPGEEACIEEALGVGEIRAELNALGSTIVQETRLSGVWLVTHLNANDEVVAKLIEITRIPSILLAQTEDIRSGVEHLNKKLGIDIESGATTLRLTPTAGGESFTG